MDKLNFTLEEETEAIKPKAITPLDLVLNALEKRNAYLASQARARTEDLTTELSRKCRQVMIQGADHFYNQIPEDQRS